MSAAVLADLHGDAVQVDVRLVVAPAAGIFTPAPVGEATAEGELLGPATVLGHVDGPGIRVPVTSFCPGFLVRLVARPGERVRVGQPLAWVHPLGGAGLPDAHRPTTRARHRPAPILPARVLGLGGALPSRRVTNHDLARHLDTSDGWIATRTGIRARRVADAATGTTELAATAGARALAAAQVRPDQVGLVVVATSTPDSPCPSTASRVAAALGIEAAAFDVGGACCGFVHAVHLAAGLLADPATGSVLVVGADRYTTLVDPTDRSTAILFGDGAGAIVLGRSSGRRPGPHTPGVLGSDLGGSPAALDVLEVPRGEAHLHMDGPELFRRASRAMAASALAALDRAGATPDDVDLFVPHQANARIIAAAARQLGLDDGRVVVDVAERGNTSAASIPLALAAAQADGRLRDGHHVLLSAVGAGLDWASLHLRWGR